MKHACLPLCALLLLLLALPAGASPVKISGDYRYTLNETGGAVITAYSGKETDLIVPSQLDGYTVTAIGKEAFQYQDFLVSVSLPKGLTHIEDKAFFSCGSLETVTLPEGLNVIGVEAFYGCSNIISLSLPEGLTSIRDGAFSFCTLTSLTLPVSLTQVGANPWLYTPVALKLAPGNSVLSLKDGALYNEAEHRLIRYPYQDKRTEFTVSEDTLLIGELAFYSCEALTTITLPEGLQTIEKRAFNDCKTLDNFILPSMVSSIGVLAFSGCESLQTLILPEVIEDIGYMAFDNCPALVLSVTRGSYAETRALEDGIPFVYTGE